MLCSTHDLQDLAIVATDGSSGAIGGIKDIYFDDADWAIRYLVVETGSWLSSRKVLISPIAVGKPDWDAQQLPVALTCDQVKSSPDIDTDMPVSRQHEVDYFNYYRYPYYWDGMSLWGRGGYPTMLQPAMYPQDGSITQLRLQPDDGQVLAQARERGNDPHLRSCKAIESYHIQASDGEIGHVKGLLYDDATWAIRYMVVSTSNWWLGHDVLIAPSWIKSIDWEDKTVSIDMTRENLQHAPWYDTALPLTRAMEIALHKHHGRAAYCPSTQRSDDPDAVILSSIDG